MHLKPAPSALHGVMFVAAAVGCFAALDTTIKFVSEAVPLAMALWIRYLFQAVSTTLALLPVRGWTLARTARPALQFMRGILLLLSSALGFFSLRYLPVGEFTAIVLLTPLFATLLASGSLGERVSILRWSLVIGGFVGAMIVIRPGAQYFSWAILLPVALVAINAGYHVLTSALAKTDDAGTMQFYTGWVGAGLATMALPFAWQAISWEFWLLLMLAGVFGTLGHFLLIFAYQRAPVAVLTPYLYLQIGFATLGGWLVFSHIPDRWSLVGIAIIAACGAAGTWVTAREGRTMRRT